MQALPTRGNFSLRAMAWLARMQKPTNTQFQVRIALHKRAIFVLCFACEKSFPRLYVSQCPTAGAAATASPTAAAARRLLSTQSATASSRQTVGPRRRLLSESPTVAPTPNVGKTSPYVSAVSATGFRVAYYKPADTKVRSVVHAQLLLFSSFPQFLYSCPVHMFVKG